jgi:metallo-beta-lactamase family protein
MTATLTFHGAARQVTGSCYLIESEKSAVLLECGLFQGPPETERLNERAFPFDAAALDAVVLSHAHLDHSGLLPKLARDGYRGPIYATPPTRDLVDILLKDAAFLQARDIEWENFRRQRAGRALLAPLYTLEDVEQALAQFRPLDYGARVDIASDVAVCFSDAGHIIGSAIVELWVGGRKLAFSGDLGNRDSLLMHDPAVVRAADVLLLESTYGDRDHRSLAATLGEFEEILATAAEGAGNVIIPAFAVERTQEILYFLGELYQAGRLKQQRVFLDSPMAIAATEVYRKYDALLNARVPGVVSRGGKQRVLPPLQYTATAEESMAINRITGGAVIIAGSGMCNGGRVRHHLKYNLWRNEAHVVIVGFQARGTPGRALVDGAKTLKLLGEEIQVRARVHTLGGFSAHAGQSQLVEWAGRFTERQPHIYLVHGEPEKMASLQTRLTQHGLDAVAADPEKTIAL